MCSGFSGFLTVAGQEIATLKTSDTSLAVLCWRLRNIFQENALDSKFYAKQRIV